MPAVFSAAKCGAIIIYTLFPGRSCVAECLSSLWLPKVSCGWPALLDRMCHCGRSAFKEKRGFHRCVKE